jgi:hypothetical protein
MLLAVPVLACGQGKGGDLLLLLLRRRRRAQAHRWQRLAEARQGEPRVDGHVMHRHVVVGARAGGAALVAGRDGDGPRLQARRLALRMHDTGRRQLRAGTRLHCSAWPAGDKVHSVMGSSQPATGEG